MKRLCGILLALAGLFLYAPCAAQNTRVRGTVTDAQTGEPIPYAVVLFPGTTTGITTDDEGFYSLESRDTSSYIRAEMVSYEPQIRPVHVGGYNQIDFRLTPSHLEIESVVITPGDNPAHPILEGIIRNKKYNDSKEYDRYICRTYTKMELGLANIREFRSKKLQQNFGFIFEHLDTSSVTGQPYLPVMISETAADYYHSRTPSVAREVIRASQISGIEDNSVLAQFTGHLHADVNLYENFIDLFGVKFASPLSNSGRSFYKYFLVDSTNVEGRKTYKIRFHPKSVATPVLDGEVNIDSASYALRSARVKMAKGVNVNWIRHLAIEADNRLTADSLWFPQREKMTADFTLTKSDSSKMIAFLGSHEVTYSDVKFDTPIPKQVLGTSASVILSDDAISGKQVEWDSLRPYTLTQKEKAIYQMVDSIQQVPLYKNIYTVLNTIIGGYYNTKYVGIGPYSKVISFNRLEGARFQIGARTTKEFSRRVRLSTYLAYGTRDEDFKGAAEVELMLRRQLLLGMTDFSMIPSYFIDDASLLHGTSSVNEAGGGLGGAVKLSTRPADADGFNLQYTQGVGSFSTFDEFLRLTYGNDRWQTSTRVVYSSSPNDFKYRNYDKNVLILDDDHNIIGSYYPIERNKSGAYHDFHALQEVYYNTGHGDRFGLQAWYVNSKRGLPMLSVDHKENDDYLNQQREQTLRSILSWDHLRKKWKVGVKAGYIHTWMAYDYERELGNGKMEKMIRSRSTINTFFGQVDGEYYLGEKWLFTATVSAHQHLVRSIDKNIIPMDNQQPTDPNGNKTKVPVGYDKGRIELSGYVSIRYRPTERLGLSIGLREEMFGSEWTPIIPAFFTDYLISKRGNLVAKASISRNYRFPSLNDLYFLPGGNPDLKKEHGFTYDAGLSFATGRDGVYTLRGEATWFDSYIDNWIVWLPTAKGFWTPKNVKEVHAYGVEVKAGLDVQLAKDWQLSADGNFSWTPSINHGDPVDWYDKAIGKQLVYIPEFSASVTGHLTYRSWRFTYKWCYYSERFTTSDNDMKTKIGRVKPYFMSDISLEKAFSFRWADLSLKGVINNLFNEEYQSVLSRPMPRLNYEIFLDIRPKWGKRNKKQ